MAFPNSASEKYLTKSIARISSLEADSHTADQEIPQLSWNTQVHHVPKPKIRPYAELATKVHIFTLYLEDMF
jgi:hypothetical protein